MPIVTMPNGDRVNFPDDMPKDQIKEKIRSKFPEDVDSGWQLAGDELLGAGKGFAKGVGNLAEELPTLGVPHVSELDPKAKEFLGSKNATYGEAIGEFGGENLPSFMVGGPEAGLIKSAMPKAGPYVIKPVMDALKTIGIHSGIGGATGALQPVKEGESRLENAAGGALTAGVLSPPVARVAGGLAGSMGAGLGVEELARRFGWGPVFAALSALGVGASHFGLSGLARKAYNVTARPTEAASKVIPAAVKGAVGGRAAEGAQENLDANTRTRPAEGQ